MNASWCFESMSSSGVDFYETVPRLLVQHPRPGVASSHEPIQRSVLEIAAELEGRLHRIAEKDHPPARVEWQWLQFVDCPSSRTLNALRMVRLDSVTTNAQVKRKLHLQQLLDLWFPTCIAILHF